MTRKWNPSFKERLAIFGRCMTWDKAHEAAAKERPVVYTQSSTGIKTRLWLRDKKRRVAKQKLSSACQELLDL